jgi:hypothetical protein
MDASVLRVKADYDTASASYCDAIALVEALAIASLTVRHRTSNTAPRVWACGRSIEEVPSE